MALGMLLTGIISFLTFVVLPVLWYLKTRSTISAVRNDTATLNRNHYAIAIIKGFLFSMSIVLGIILVIFILVYLFVDLSVS